MVIVVETSSIKYDKLYLFLIFIIHKISLFIFWKSVKLL